MTGTIFAQSDTIKCLSTLDTLTGIKVYQNVDKFPSVNGGDELLFAELNKLEHPTCGHYEGKIWVAFIVDIDGSLKGKRILRDVEGTDFGKQVLTLIDNLKWIPAECNGQKVATIYRFPMNICYK